jgi:hypothetical protein
MEQPHRAMANPRTNSKGGAVKEKLIACSPALGRCQLFRDGCQCWREINGYRVEMLDCNSLQLYLHLQLDA